jgi:DNA-binding NtrC family response regulator
LRNYEVATARTLSEAIHDYGPMSPRLIFVDVSLGRPQGIDLIPSLRNVVGIEEIPVILVDEPRNVSRRGAAQRGGAIDYLSYPIDVPRIASQIEKRSSSRRDGNSSATSSN